MFVCMFEVYVLGVSSDRIGVFYADHQPMPGIILVFWGFNIILDLKVYFSRSLVCDLFHYFCKYTLYVCMPCIWRIILITNGFTVVLIQ